MRKKVVAIIMAGMMIFSLAGCQKKATSENTQSTAETSTVETAESGNSETESSKTEKQNSSSDASSSASDDKAEESASTSSETTGAASSGTTAASEQEQEPLSVTERVEQAEQMTEQGKSWEDVLNDAGVTITDEMRQEYESMSTPSLQTEYAIVEVEGQKAKVEQYSEYLSVYGTLVTQMVTTPIIYSDDNYTDTVADFKAARSEFDTVAQKASISDDEFQAIKQKIVDAYNFLEQAQVTVGTSTKNEVKSIQKELES